MKNTPFFARAFIFVFSLILLQPGSAHAQGILNFNGAGSEVSGTVQPGEFQHYEVTIPASFSGWSVDLARTAGATNLSLYVRKDLQPTEGDFLANSLNGTQHQLFFEEGDLLAGQTYFVSAFLPSNASQASDFTLKSLNTIVREIGWDPGVQQTGSELFTIENGAAGDYVFRLTTQNSQFGAWRTVLNVTSGEANILLRQDSVPTPQRFDFRAQTVGSDAVVEPLSTTSGAGETWYIRVIAEEGASWSLFSGDVFLEDLGDLSETISSSSSERIMGPEGVQFFRTSLPEDLLAWRLWTRNSANETVASTIFTRPSLVPLNKNTSFYESRLLNGQGLLVDDDFNLQPGLDYYVAVYADPGSEYLLDNREQTVTDLPFGSTLNNQQSDGFNFRTFKVEVPIEQVAWEVTINPTLGEPQFFVKRDSVPNVQDKDFTSELYTGDSSQSLTLVPNQFSNGTYYITVFADEPFSYDIVSKQPEITQILFNDSVVNTDANRSGWRFFRVLNNDSIPGNQQLGQLGWELELEGADIEGAEIYIRRVNAPGRSNQFHDLKSTVGILQDPERVADTWYIGVFRKDDLLGDFTLNSRPIPPDDQIFEESSKSIQDLQPGLWSFSKIIVPEQVGGEDVLGWELRVKDWMGQQPLMVVRRALLPEQSGNKRSDGGGLNVQSVTSFEAGQQHQASRDWTFRNNQADGSSEGADQLLTLATGNPLEPGIYYVGVKNLSNTVPFSGTLQSRAIGVGMALNVVDVTFGDDQPVPALAARDVAYYRYTLTQPISALQLRLNPVASTGEGLLYARQKFIPNSQISSSQITRPFEYGDALPRQLKLQKTGQERVIMLPSSNVQEPDPVNRVPAGEYFIMVVSEGDSPANAQTVGTGDTSFTLESQEGIDTVDLGVLSSGESQTIEEINTTLIGETRYYRFQVPSGLPGVSVDFENFENSGARLDFGTFVNEVIPKGSSGYGIVEGANSLKNLTGNRSFTISDLDAGEYIIVVRNSSTTVPASFRFTLKGESATNLNFNDGSATVTDLAPSAWQYFTVTVPETVNGESVLGWEVRIKDWGSTENRSVPRVEVRRDLFPDGSSGAFINSNSIVFSSGNRIALNQDWTQRNSDSTGSTTGVDRLVSLAMGNPLEPGEYVIGVQNTSTTQPLSLNLLSRGIGRNLSLDVIDVDLDTTEVLPALPAREIAYLRYEVPEPDPTMGIEPLTELEFEMSLPDDAEALMIIREGFLPTSLNQGQANAYPFNFSGGLSPTLRLKQNGRERLTLLPSPAGGEDGSQAIPPGTYYVLLVSEGNLPTAANRVGTGEVAITLNTSTTVPVQDLGIFDEGGFVEIDGTTALGENDYFTFEVTDNVPRLLIRLFNTKPATPATSAQPVLVLSNANAPVLPGRPNAYGLQGGTTSTLTISNSGNIQIPNPEPGRYKLLVRERGALNANYKFSIDAFIVGDPTVDLDFNTGEMTRILAPQRPGVYKVIVPDSVNGVPVEGWEVRVKGIEGQSVPTVTMARDMRPDSPESQAAGVVSPSMRAFPSLKRVSFADDWARRNQTAEGGNTRADKVATLAMGNPLEPGDYFIVVFNNSQSENLKYTITSKGIGAGLGINVVEAELGDAVNINNLPTRGVSFVKYTVPDPVSAMRFALETDDLTPGAEGLLYIRQSFIPISLNTSSPNQLPLSYTPGALVRQSFVDRVGDERLTLIPGFDETFGRQSDILPAGTYYAMVVSQGNSPTSTNRVGTGDTNFTLSSAAGTATVDLGVLPVAAPPVQSGLEVEAMTNLQPGESQFYEFEVPVNVDSLNINYKFTGGSASLNLRYLDEPDVTRFFAGNSNRYGLLGGDSVDEKLTGTNVYTLGSPRPGRYGLTLHNSNTNSEAMAEFDLSVSRAEELVAGVDTERSFESQRPKTWKYYVVDIPETFGGEEVLGWELRLTDWEDTNDPSRTMTKPILRIRRDLAPDTDANRGVPSNSPIFETGNVISSTLEWSKRATDADGSRQSADEIISLAMGHPLEPGRYYIGVQNRSSAEELSFNLKSRLIGKSMNLDVRSVNLESDVDTGEIEARDVSYFRYDVTTPIPVLELKLALSEMNPLGEGIMLVREGLVPTSIRTSVTNKVPFSNEEKLTDQLILNRLQGGEQVVLIPESISGVSNQTYETLPVGVYFVTVVSLGNNPMNTSSVGSGSTRFTLNVSTQRVPIDLGLASSSAALEPGVESFGLATAEFYNFDVSAEEWPVELFVKSLAGTAPQLSWRDGPGFAGTRTASRYGVVGGLANNGAANDTAYTIINPRAGEHGILIQAQNPLLQASEYELSVTVKEPQPLAFSGGDPDLANVNTSSLNRNGYDFYRIEVPENLGGARILGWSIRVSADIGNAGLRVLRGSIPLRPNGQRIFSQTGDQLIIDFEDLEPGTYFAEVRTTSVGGAEYLIESRAITENDALRTWDLPARGATSQTPGLSGRQFGDTGIDITGNPLVTEDNDQGVDLGRGDFHLYKVNVPDDNEGILRIQLDAISGNPDLYVRREALGTPRGSSDFRLVGLDQTEYGNWVVENTKIDQQFEPGTYYVLVEAASEASARYRLSLSTGNITDVDIFNGEITDVNVSKNDWAYIKVTAPLDLSTWDLDFTVTQGSADLYIRDVVPPGELRKSASLQIRSWTNEAKNQGPYPTFQNDTMVSLNAPQIRPGSDYYVGVRARTDAIISLNSSTSGSVLNDPEELSFFGGERFVSIAANSVRYYKVRVPRGQPSLEISTGSSGSIPFFVEQGSFPTLSNTDDFSNITNDGFVAFSRNITGTWPWVDSQFYYIALQNISGSSQTAFITVGEARTDSSDTDNDFLPDAWEDEVFGSTEFGSSPDDEFDDGDTTPVILEYLFGQDPTVADTPDLKGTRVSGDYVLSFTKRKETPTFDFVYERSETLLPNSWMEVTLTSDATSLDADFESMEATDEAVDKDKYFYRIRIVAPSP